MYVKRCPYIEALKSCHVHCPDGLNNTLLSQDCILENGFHCGNGGRMYISRTGVVVKNLHLLKSSSQISGHILSMTSSNNYKFTSTSSFSHFSSYQIYSLCRIVSLSFQLLISNLVL